MVSSWKSKTLMMAAVVLAWPTAARAEGEGEAQAQQPAPQPEGDAWDAAMKQGIKQEGRMTLDQIQKKEKAESEEVDAVVAIRERLRFGLFVGGGGGISAYENNLTNGVETQAVGPEFQIGAGIRKGFNLEWEIQGRALFTVMTLDEVNHGSYYSYSGSGPNTTTSKDVGTGMGGSVDGTGRYHFGGITKPWYFGFGARVDFLASSAEATSERTLSGIPLQTKKHTASTLEVAPMALTELGVVLLDDRIDLALRVAGGAGFHAGLMAGVLF